MNNKGFIATGLIYTFFLIFLTLFLTTITSHIKNKVNLSYIEDGIKEELNSYKSVRNFNPGDLISFVESCDDAGNFKVENSYVVASVMTNIEGRNDYLVLYSYGLDANSTDVLTYENIKKDISTGYLNNTYINKILYNFDNSNSNSYSIGNNLFVSLDSVSGCFEGNNVFCTDYGKIVSTGSSYYRKRVEDDFEDSVFNKKVKKCSVQDAMGVIYVIKR